MSFGIRTAAGWAIRLAMIPLVARQHGPTHAMAWLAPILLFPRAGTLFYLWLARFGLARSARRHREVREQVETRDLLGEAGAFRIREAAEPGHRDLIRLAERIVTDQIGGFPILGGNAVELLDAPGGMVRRLIGDVERA